MLIIANPTARSGKGRKLWPYWQKALAAADIAYHWHTASSADDCRNRACNTDSLVIAAGGDGTINNVINGVMQTYRPCTLGVLYAGTSPDFCRFHNIPAQPRTALQTLLRGHDQNVDVAEITYQNNHKEVVKRFYTCSCNVGLGADVAAFANKYRKYLGDACGTGLGLLKAVLKNRPFSARLTLDSRNFTFNNVNHVMILKNPYIASGLKVATELTPDDGRLLAVVIHGYSRLGWLWLMKALYRGTLLQKPGVFARFCQRAVIETPFVQTVEFDGDPRGFTPVTISLKPKALVLRCGGQHV